MQVKCFYENKPETDVIFVIYSDFSGGQKFFRKENLWYDDEGAWVDEDWFIDSDTIWFIELKE